MTDDDNETNDDHLLELRSFGRKRGRKLSPRQEALLGEVMARVRVDMSQPFELVSDPKGLTPWDRQPSAPECTTPPLWLEIGFGGGEHLLWQAQHNPGTLLIGCEPFVEGVVKVLSAIDAERIGNIRLHDNDARPLLRWLPAASIDRCFILFPDPWPKKRHVKRRLVSQSTLALVVRALKPGGELRIATDIGDYARTMMIALAATPELRWRAREAADWRNRPADWPQTRYEAKAVAAGRARYYLSFERI